MAVVDELITLLGFETKPGSEGKMNRFKASMGKMVDAAKKAAAAIAAMTAAVGAWAIAAAKGADETLKMSKSLGLSVEELQRLQFAADQAGTSAGALNGLLEKAQEFGLQGQEGIARLADSFEGLDARTASFRGKAFGLSEEQIRLLRLGGEEIRRLGREADELGIVITEEQAKAAEQFTSRIKMVQKAVVGLAREAAINALPAMQELTDAFLDWFKQNRQLLASGLSTFIEGVTKGVRGFVEVVQKVARVIGEIFSPLDGFFERLDKVEVISGVVTGGLTILAGVLAVVFAKFIAIAAAIGVAALAIEDFLVFLKGGESVIGTFLAAFEERLPGIFGLLKALVQLVGVGLVGAFNILKAAVEPVFAFIRAGIQKLVGAINLVDRALQKLGFGKKSAQIDVTTRQFEEQLANLGNQNQGAVQAQAPQPATTPVNPAIAGTTNNVSNAGDVIINIDGAQDPANVAREVVKQGGFQQSQQIGSPGTFAQGAT